MNTKLVGIVGLALWLLACVWLLGDHWCDDTALELTLRERDCFWRCDDPDRGVCLQRCLTERSVAPQR